MNLPGYRFGENLYQGTRTLVYRGTRISDHRSVIIKVLRNPHPNFNELVQLRNQYAIASHLEHPAIVRPLALERYGNGYALVMLDGGELALKDYWQQLEGNLPEFLAIAIQLSEALHYLIQQRIVHKDIKPSNILIQPETRLVKLIDFSISSLLPKEQQQLTNPNLLEGTLAYISPEQTGRMNRGIDYRTDFYSLGATFFELLTGQLPFSTRDPMELVHCHIARAVEFPVKSEVPVVLQAIVKKLMAKNAEDRYQSALGLKYDLERCLEQLEATGEIASFEIGKRDRSDRFIIPEKLYGRETQVQTLLDAFDRVALGNTEMMLVAGFSGVGKTAVINEVHKPIVKQRGYFIKGKFDQLNRNIPFSAFVQAILDLMGQLLGSSDGELQEWKASILEAVGENGQVLSDAIPGLERIIGKQPPVPELSGSAAQNRFNLLFGKFIRVFTTIEHPLVIFLDDLQWADLASLNLLKLLMEESEGGYLLVLGAYRDNEVWTAHPLMLLLDELQKERAVISTITLEPLAQSHINQLVAGALSCSEDIARSLTELVYQKTKGNPFFTTQFLIGLYEEDLIIFNLELGYWECDLARVHDAALTSDVVEFMAGRLHKLPDVTQEVLKLAACVGNQFDLETLAIVSEQSWEDVAANLWAALQEGLVLPASETYKFFQGEVEQTRAISVEYRFLHDRVQQAAYSLIPQERKREAHLKIGKLLLQKTPESQKAQKLFDIVNQINIGVELITDRAELNRLASLNLQAGTKAKLATAYTAALKYFDTGLGLLPKDCWQHCYSLALTLHENAAEAAYLAGNLERMEELVKIVTFHAKSCLDRVKTLQIKMQFCAGQNQFLECIEIARNLLQELGFPLPKSPTMEDVKQELENIEDVVAKFSLDEIAELPALEDPHKLAAASTLMLVSAAAIIADPNLNFIVISTQVKLSLEYGNSPYSPYAYSCYGIWVNVLKQDLERLYQFGQLALKLLSQSNSTVVSSKVFQILGAYATHGKRHVKETLQFLTQAYSSGLESGDFEFAGYSIFAKCQNFYFLGRELTDLEKEITNFDRALLSIQQKTALSWNQPFYRAVVKLLGRENKPHIFGGDSFDADEFVRFHSQINDRFGLHYFYFNQAILLYLFEDSSRALENSKLAEKYLDGPVGFLTETVFYFYDSLIRLGCVDELDNLVNSELLTKVCENQKKMKIWADSAPMNFQHKYDLARAEERRISCHKLEAMELYDRAIAGAKENEYLQEEALANELAAKFYLDWGKEKIAAVYMQDAYYCYARWSAKAKTEQLEAKYPQLLAPILQQQRVEFNPIDSLESIATTLTSVRQDGTRTGTQISEALDFASILQAAQILSGSIELEQLLIEIVQIILTNAGAQKTVLFVPHEDEQWQLRAMAKLTDDGTVETSTKSRPISPDIPAPVRLVQYVKNTKKPVLIDEAKTEIAGILQGYLLKYQPQSVFCLPLLERGNLVAILYLEHPTTKGVFTRHRQTIVEFISAGAAICLKNAWLYSQSKSYVERLERSLQTLQKTQSKLIENEQIMQTQVLAISNLSQSKAISSGELKTSFQELTTATASTLKVERVSIWLFDKGGTIIDCVDLFESSRKHHSQGFELLVADNPYYFSAINLEALLVSDDVQNDPRTRDFQDDYLVPLNIVSMLDANVLLDGQIYGILCCEQVASKRVWTQAEQNFVRSVANLVALTLEANLRRQKEEKLERALVDLKQSQLQLVQSEKMSALGNLVAGVAHEINNPIGFLQGNIEPARDYVEDLLGLIDLYQKKMPNPDAEIEEEIEAIELEFIREDLPKLLESMTIGVERIGNISNSLRTFSRKDREQKTEFDIHEGIDSTLLILKHRTKAKVERPEIEIIKDYQELPEINCYPGQLNQVFMNIIANAIDAFDEANEGKTYSEIEANPNRITIRTSMLEEAVEIMISDNAGGMKPEILDRIFEQGFTTKGVGKGTGLGMAIARNIVTEKHGGTITCDSNIGVGTTFALVLPTKG